MNIKPEIDGFNAGWKAGKASAQAKIDMLRKHQDRLRKWVADAQAEIAELKKHKG
jgi:hypothetical protein